MVFTGEHDRFVRLPSEDEEAAFMKDESILHAIVAVRSTRSH